MYTIKWKDNFVSMLDQRKLPLAEVYNDYTDYPGVAEAIRRLEVRGAPAIGIAAAMGIALGAIFHKDRKRDMFIEEMNNVFDIFAATRPTAVNLFWAIERMKKILVKEGPVHELVAAFKRESEKILQEDIDANHRMGANGSGFFQDGDVVMTHCNAGALATGGFGTALGVIRAAIEEGKNISVYACETRPVLQGARLTAWELMADGIEVTIITDNMAAWFMKKGIIKKIIVGADRVAANGDVANKIGTYSHAVAAKYHNIPFYVAAPVSTLDGETATGDDIVIEERSVDEVAFVGESQVAPEGVTIRNPAFDVTPADLVTAIITEKGVIENPGENGIMESLK